MPQKFPELLTLTVKKVIYKDEIRILIQLQILINIIHKENTKEITTVAVVLYVIKLHVHLPKT